MRITVITINYNNLEGLKKTVVSVVEQTYTDLEYIVIDGGSTDGSAKYVENYHEDIAYWVSEPDKGIYNAMNKGIDKATGDYLLFLNSGDVLITPTVFDEFVNHSKFKGDIIYGDYVFKDGGKQYPDHLTPFFFMRTSLPHQSTLFHKSVFEKMGGYDETYKLCADRDFYLKCFLSGEFLFSRVPIALSLFDLSGLSNDLEYLEIKKQEDERLFKTNFGIYYEDYQQMIFLQKELNETKRETFNGILKRIKNKMISICRIH